MGIFKSDQELVRRTVADAILTDPRLLVLCTFNTHLDISDRECRSRVERTFHVIHRRMFRGTRYQGIPTEQLLRLMGGFERRRKTGHPHAHLLAWMDEVDLERFLRLARVRWERTSPGGAVDFRVVADKQGSAEKLAWYVTKNVDLKGIDAFVTEVELGLPRFGGALVATRTKGSV